MGSPRRLRKIGAAALCDPSAMRIIRAYDFALVLFGSGHSRVSKKSAQCDNFCLDFLAQHSRVGNSAHIVSHLGFSRTTAHPVANEAHNLNHPLSSSQIGCSNLGQPVRKCSSSASPVSTLPPVQSELDFHRLTLHRQVPQTAVVPAVPMLTPRSTILADADRFRSSGNNPVSFILKGDTQNFDPWAG